MLAGNRLNICVGASSQICTTLDKKKIHHHPENRIRNLKIKLKKKCEVFNVTFGMKAEGYLVLHLVR